MNKVSPLKLTLVIIPLAILLTLLIRYMFTFLLGVAIHPAITLVAYIVIFSVLKIGGEKVLRNGKYAWFLLEDR